MTSFGDKLRDLRLRRQLSQTEVVHELKELLPDLRISQTTYSVWENSTSVPSQGALKAVAAYFGLGEYYFTDEDTQGIQRAKELLERIINRDIWTEQQHTRSEDEYWDT